MIIVDYSPFDQESRAYILDDEGKMAARIATNMQNLIAGIQELADNYNDYEIKVNAPVGFVNEIAMQLTTTNYTEKNFNVERI